MLTRLKRLTGLLCCVLILIGAPAYGQPDDASQDTARLARIHEQNAEYDLAIEKYGETIDRLEATAGPFSAKLIEPLTGLGRSYIAVGELPAADEALRRAQHLAHRNEGVYSLSQIPVIEVLTEQYLQEDKPLAADRQQRFKLFIREHRYGKDSTELLPALYEITEWYMGTGQYHYARETLERAMEIIESGGGENDPRLIKPLRMLAVTRRLQGVCCSYRSLEDALDIVENNAAITGDTIVDLYLALGDAYTVSHKEDEARRYYRDAWHLARDRDNRTSFDEPAKIAMSARLNQRFGHRVDFYRLERDPLGRVVPEKMSPEEKLVQEHQPPQKFVLPLDVDRYNVRIADPVDKLNQIDDVMRMVGQPFQFNYKQLRYILPLSLQTLEDIASLHVTLEFTVESSGNVDDIEVTDSNAPIRLRRLMKKTLRETVFRPALEDGHPVTTHNVKLTQTFEYRKG